MTIRSSGFRWTVGFLLLAAVVFGVAAAGVRISRLRREAELRRQTSLLRQLYFENDAESAVLEGVRLTRRFPEASELRAWYLLSLARFSRTGEALHGAKKMISRDAGDPWGWFALAGSGEGPEEGIAASEKALAMMPRHPDFIWLRAWTLLLSDERAQEAVEFVDRHLAEVERPAELMVVKARALQFLGTQIRPNADQVAAAYAILEKVRRIDPNNFHAHYLPGLYYYRLGEPEKGLPLVKSALALAPGSSRAHLEYWRAFNVLEPARQSGLRAAIEADLESLRRNSEDRPWTLSQIAEQYGKMGQGEKQRSLEEHILRKYPGSHAEKLVLASRLKRMASATGLYDPERRRGQAMEPRLHEPPEENWALDRATERALTDSFRGFLWDYVDRAHDKDDWLLEQVYVTLFDAVENDPAYEPERVEAIVSGLVERPLFLFGYYEARGLRLLADRGIHLDQAEALARTALLRVERRLMDDRKNWENPEEFQQSFEEATGGLHDALGWVLFRQGRLDEAEKELNTAARLHPGEVHNLYHRGRLAETRGELRRAEDFFAECAVVPMRGDNPCEPLLGEIRRRRTGSRPDDLRHPAGALMRGKELRKRRLLSTRIGQPAAIPPFRLETLDGEVISSNSLKGKVGVIDFWGVWCHGCVQSMPDFQKLVDKYRDDPEVAILTIDTWDSRAQLQNWLRKNPYTFPILIDDGYVEDVKVGSFPTTWFLDRQGRLSYVLRGNEGNLVEEDSWLIEDLKRR